MTVGYSRAVLDDYAFSVAQLTVRAEGLTDLDGTFVETIFPEMIQVPQHQIIYGRRGSGKTHLLRRIDVGLRKTFSENGILPIYVNGSRLSQGIGIVSSDPAMVALTIYVELMQHIGTEIRRFVAELNQAKFWDQVAGGKKSQKARQADTIAAELEQTLTSGQVRVFPRGEVSEEMTTLSESSRNSSIGASVKSDPRNLGWTLRAGTSAERTAKTSSRATKIVHGEIILSFSDVASKLNRLLELLNGASVYVLFDEWSEVDNNLDVQPYLAEMLRRTASAVPRIYLKLACVPGRTILATPITEDTKTQIGLEEGEDVTADVNLDSIEFSSDTIDQLVFYFMDMIKKHVGEKIEWVRFDTLLSFRTFLTTMIFSDMKPFVELCQASAGVARDFLSIYKAATAISSNMSKSSQSRVPIDLATVRLAGVQVYEGKRTSFTRSTSSQLDLLDRIYQEIYVKKDSYQFLLSEEQAVDDGVQTLYMKKLIHRSSGTYYDTKTGRRYLYFLLDYGTTIARLMDQAATDVRASYQISIWTKVESRANKFLGRTSTRELSQEKDEQIAAIRALFSKEAGRLDIDPRELIFQLRNPAPRAPAGRSQAKHRRRR